MKRFKSIFAERLSAYVELRRGLGLKFEAQDAVLHRFDRYLFEREHDGLLTQELAIDFSTHKSNVSRTACARRYQVIRNFSEYLTTFEPRTPPMDPGALHYSKVRPPAHIFTDEELGRVLHEARHISATNPVRGVTLHAMVGLAAGTGLRISEVVRLDKADVDLDTGVLVIRKTKFNKERLVPVHPTALDVLRNYAAVRDATFPECTCPAFFINMWRRHFARHTLQLAFWDATRRAGLREDKGKGPSFHDLRHTFAVRRLVAWYKAGVDVQAMLPALATYMGHVHYSHTAYYVTATPELMALAADRYHGSIYEGEVQT